MSYSNEKIIALRAKLPELKKELVAFEKEYESIGEQIKLWKKMIRIAEEVTEVVDGFPLSIGPYFMYRAGREHPYYAYYYNHPDDVELQPKKQRWVLELLHHPRKESEDFKQLIEKVYYGVHQKRNQVIDLAREWVINGKLPDAKE